MSLPETQYTRTADGVHLAYQVSGGGDVDLVLLHGQVSHLEIAWEDAKLRGLYERLGSFARLIRFDRRGMGMSDPLEAVPTFEAQLDDFANVMDAAGSASAAIMGTGDAGVLALAFAARRPERVSSVVAFESAPRLLPSPDDDYGVEIGVLQRMAAANEALDLETHLSIVAPPARTNPASVRGFGASLGPRRVAFESTPSSGTRCHGTSAIS
jgi:pimeloyl-ACP methyl ester carboxylesterase